MYVSERGCSKTVKPSLSCRDEGDWGVRFSEGSSLQDEGDLKGDDESKSIALVSLSIPSMHREESARAEGLVSLVCQTLMLLLLYIVHSLYSLLSGISLMIKVKSSNVFLKRVWGSYRHTAACSIPVIFLWWLSWENNLLLNQSKTKELTVEAKKQTKYRFLGIVL